MARRGPMIRAAPSRRSLPMVSSSFQSNVFSHRFGVVRSLSFLPGAAAVSPHAGYHEQVPVRVFKVSRASGVVRPIDPIPTGGRLDFWEARRESPGRIRPHVKEMEP